MATAAVIALVAQDDTVHRGAGSGVDARGGSYLAGDGSQRHMPTVIVHHNVKDTKHWLASPKRKELLEPLGITSHRLFVDPQNPSRVAVLMDVSDLDALTTAMATQQVADAMEHDGVLADTVVFLVET